MGLKCKTYFSGLLLLFLLYQPFSVAASSGSVLVGISPFKPFIFMDNQAPTGFTIDLWEMVAEELDLDFTYNKKKE